MPKFKFSLEKLLRQRHIQVDLAQKDFLEIQKVLNDEIIIRDQMVELKNNSLQQRQSLIQTEGQWQLQVNQLNDFLKGQDLRIARQNERLIKIEKEVEKYREILRNALVEAKMVEGLKEKQKAEFIKDVLKKEQAEVDEIVTMRYNSKEEA